MAQQWLAGERIVADKLSTYAGEPVVREANSAAFTTTETEHDSITVPVVEGRRYKIVWDGEYQSTVANDVVRARIREDIITGTVRQLRHPAIDVADQAFPAILQFFYTATATEDKTFVASALRLTGSGSILAVANSTSPTNFYVENA